MTYTNKSYVRRYAQEHRGQEHVQRVIDRLTCSSGWPRWTRLIASQQPGDQQSDPDSVQRPQPVGAENPVASCGLQVFVGESAEAVASEVANVRSIGWRSGSSCRWL